MIERLSIRLSNFWATNGLVKQTDVELYRYGLELLLSTAANLVILFFISLLLCHPSALIYFLVSFIPLRTTAGGYHATSHFKCITLCASAYAIGLLLINYARPYFVCMIFTMSSLCSLVLLVMFAPIPISNKLVTKEEARTDRYIAILLGIILLILNIIFLELGPPDNTNILMLFFGELLATCLLILGVKK